MTAFKKPTAYSDAKCEWVSPTYPYDEENAQLKDENAKLRELVRDMWNEGMCECGSRGKCTRCEYDYPDRMRELGVIE